MSEADKSLMTSLLSAPALIALATAVGCALLWTFHAMHNSHFVGDDFDHFIAIVNLPWHEFILRPIDVHVVPLHRLFTWFIYHWFPYNYTISLIILLLFYLASLATLTRILLHLTQSTVAAALLILAGANLFLLELFIWWSSGIHRMPYILFALLAVLSYLHLRRGGHLGWLALLLASQAVGLGFYSKSVLIPGYLLAMELCFFASTFPKPALERAALVRAAVALGTSLLLSLIYVLWYVFFSAHPGGTFVPELSVVMTVIGEMIMILLQSVAGLKYQFTITPVNWLVLGLWLLAVLYTIVRSPRVAVHWLVLSCVVAVNFLLIASSDRANSFGVYIAYSYRYYFDLLFLLVIFGALIIEDVRHRPGVFKSPRLSGACRSVGQHKSLLLAGFAVLFTAHSISAGLRHFEQDHTRDHVRAHHFLSTAQQSLQALDITGLIPFAEGALPQDLNGGLFGIPLRHSEFLPTLLPQAWFGVLQGRTHLMDGQGHIAAFAVDTSQERRLYAFDHEDGQRLHGTCMKVEDNVLFLRAEDTTPPPVNSALLIDYELHESATGPARTQWLANLYYNVASDTAGEQDEAIHHLALDTRYLQKVVILQQPMIAAYFRLSIDYQDPQLCISRVRLFPAEPVPLNQIHTQTSAR